MRATCSNWLHIQAHLCNTKRIFIGVLCVFFFSFASIDIQRTQRKSIRYNESHTVLVICAYYYIRSSNVNGIRVGRCLYNNAAHVLVCAVATFVNSFTVHFYVFLFFSIYKTSYDCCEWTLKRKTHYDYIAVVLLLFASYLQYSRIYMYTFTMLWRLALRRIDIHTSNKSPF